MNLAALISMLSYVKRCLRGITALVQEVVYLLHDRTILTNIAEPPIKTGLIRHGIQAVGKELGFVGEVVPELQHIVVLVHA